MPILPSDNIVVSYNAFFFPPYSRTKVSAHPVYDSSRRRLMYVSFKVTVDSFITADPGSDVEAQLITIRQKLTQRGGILILQNTGFGELTVNVPDGPRDVADGPHPEILDCQPIGSRSAWLITWSCTANLPQCEEGTSSTTGRPMAFCYTWDVSQDEQGYSTRTIQGELIIPSTVAVGEVVQTDAAERYWNRVIASIVPIPGFQRQHNRSLSQDRRTLNFTITDTEKPPNNFIPECSTWNGSQELSTSLQDGFRKYISTISASYTISRDRPKRDAYQAFLALVSSRVQQAKQFAGAKSILPISYRWTDQLASSEVSFVFSFQLLIKDPKIALQAAGFLLPVPLSNWAVWAVSMARSALAARGNANLMWNPTSDTLIDLCQDTNLKPVAGGGALSGFAGASLSNFQPTMPTPDNSWVAYECKIVIEGDQGTNTLRVLPLTDLNTVGGDNSGNTAFSIGTANPSPLRGYASSNNTSQQTGTLVNGILPPPVSSQVNVVQQRALPDMRVRVTGRALRIAYPVDRPQLLAAAGQPAILERPRFGQTVVANYGLPVIGAAWDDTYVIPGQSSQDLPMPPNPIVG